MRTSLRKEEVAGSIGNRDRQEVIKNAKVGHGELSVMLINNRLERCGR